jgi:hypothetical protein
MHTLPTETKGHRSIPQDGRNSREGPECIKHSVVSALHFSWEPVPPSEFPVRPLRRRGTKRKMITVPQAFPLVALRTD